MEKGRIYLIHEEQITDSNANFRILGAGILFQNQGDVPVTVGLIKLLPGDVYKIDIMPPHVVDQNIKIRFESASVPTGGSLRVTTGRLLVYSTLMKKED